MREEQIRSRHKEHRIDKHENRPQKHHRPGLDSQKGEDKHRHTTHYHQRHIATQRRERGEQQPRKDNTKEEAYMALHLTTLEDTIEGEEKE